MKNKYFIIFIIVIVLTLTISISLFAFGNNSKDDASNKMDQEISYIETKLLGMLNSLNNITLSDSVLLEQNTSKTEDYTKYSIDSRNVLINTNESIDWSYLKNNIEVLYSTWPTIVMDLKSVNVNDKDILEFSNILDNLVITIEKEEKKECLINLASLYSLLPRYLKQYSNDIDKINLFYTKSCIINSYVLLEDENWEEMTNQINDSIEYFNNIINSINKDKNQSSISKIYIALNEMKNAIKLQDRKLYYLKYINLMESALEL